MRLLRKELSEEMFPKAISFGSLHYIGIYTAVAHEIHSISSYDKRNVKTDPVQFQVIHADAALVCLRPSVGRGIPGRPQGDQPPPPLQSEQLHMLSARLNVTTTKTKDKRWYLFAVSKLPTSTQREGQQVRVALSSSRAVRLLAFNHRNSRHQPLYHPPSHAVIVAVTRHFCNRHTFHLRSPQQG